MPGINVDFSTVPSNEPVPAGSYLVVVENVELKENKEGKLDPDTGEVAKYLNWELTITEGDFAGRKLFTITSLLRKALWKLRTLLVNLDAFEDNLNLEIDEDTNQVLEPELVGRVGTAVVKIGKDNKGNDRAEVDTILDADGMDREKAMRSERKAEKGTAPKMQNVETGNVPAARPERKMTLR